MALEPITRSEQIISGESLKPTTRKEMFLAKMAGMDVKTPEPITREEMFLQQAIENGGSAPVIEALTVTENGTYNAPEGVDGYNPVTVNVASSGDDLKGLIERTATTVNVPSGTTQIGDYAFYYCGNMALTSLPSSVTSIGSHAFYGCYKLALTSLPSSVTSIGDYAFYGCSKLALTSLPSGVTSIENYGFHNCSKLELTSFPSGVTKIGNSAFYNCTGLTEITFEGTPETMYSKSFSNCYNLLTINVPWAEGAVSGAPWGATNATINYNYTGG